MDWTEKRDEFGLAQNFTVSYGEDESEYYYLLIDWVPNATIRELTDNANSTIAALPQELREDVIVMEITLKWKDSDKSNYGFSFRGRNFLCQVWRLRNYRRG